MRHILLLLIASAAHTLVAQVLAQSEVKEIPRLRYNTCDLDLSPEVLNQLPSECLEVDAVLRDKLLQESQLFKRFWERLEGYEADSDLEYQEVKRQDPLVAAIPQKNWVIRQRVYEAVDLLLCQNGTEVTYDQFADCMITRRQEMYRLLEVEILNDVK